MKVKQESAKEFLVKYSSARHDSCGGVTGLDRLLVFKGKITKPVIFELHERVGVNEIKLTLTYSVESFDDIHDELIQTDRIVEFKE